MERLKQRRFFTVTAFEFDTQKLHYRIGQADGAISFSVHYAAISMSGNRQLEEKSVWARNTGMVSLMIGMLQGLVRFKDTGVISPSIWLVLGVACLSAYLLVRIRYTVIGTEYGDIMIIRDKQHDRIMGEIRERRKQQLLEWYGTINYDNDPNDEVNKFLWLKNQNLISEEDLKAVIQKLNTHHQNRSEGFYEMEEDGKIIN